MEGIAEPLSYSTYDQSSAAAAAAAALHHHEVGLGVMQPSDSPERSHKRRRLDGQDHAAGAGLNPPDVPQWHDQPHTAASTTATTPSAYPVPHALAPPYRAPVAQSPEQDGSPPLNGNDHGSHPHQHHHQYAEPPSWSNPSLSNDASAQPSAYPELTPYHQQPYFHDRQSSRSSPYHQGEETWQAPPTSSYPPVGVGSSSSSYPARDQPGTAVMPYFPSSESTYGKAEPHMEAPPSSYYPAEIESATPYPYPQQVSALSRSHDATRHGSPYYNANDDASMNMKIQSLPILDNLATQLIHTLSKASYQQIKELMSGSDAEESQAYATLKSLFDQTRKVYSRETPFIDAIAIQMFQPNQQEIIRKANIATFISSILGAFDVTFYHLNEYFMETFVPLSHRLLKWQGAIYLEMKTQTYISSLLNSQGSPEELLEELFPPDLDAQILTRHPDAPSLSPSEQDFIDRSRQRKSYLLAEPASAETARELQKKYSWQDFSREFAAFISKNVDGIMNVPTRAHAGGRQSANESSTSVTKAGSGSIAGSILSTLSKSITAAGNAKSRSDSNADGKKPFSGTGAGPNGTPGASGPSTAPTSTTAGTSSTIRQPWTKPEEDALLSGLERVNGPHWSQILALYGRGGSVSEVLKDRNQVQLKDKARNLKLWYLKTGKEVPASLKGVTGELRKRGGARARAALEGAANAAASAANGEAGNVVGGEGGGVGGVENENAENGKGGGKKKAKK